MKKVNAMIFLLAIAPLIASCNSEDLCEDLKLYKLKLCDEPEPDYFEVGITYNKMLRDPVLFCNYVGDNSAKFTDKFRNCAQTHIDNLISEIQNTRSYCESIFIDSSDVIWCEDKYDSGSLSNSTFWLSAMLEVTNQTNNCYLTNCDCALLGSQLQIMVDLWNAEIPTGRTWQQIIDDALPYHKTSYACE